MGGPRVAQPQSRAKSQLRELGLNFRGGDFHLPQPQLGLPLIVHPLWLRNFNLQPSPDYTSEPDATGIGQGHWSF